MATSIGIRCGALLASVACVLGVSAVFMTSVDGRLGRTADRNASAPQNKFGFAEALDTGPSLSDLFRPGVPAAPPARVTSIDIREEAYGVAPPAPMVVYGPRV